MISQQYYDQLAIEYRAQDDFWDNPYDREIWRVENDLSRKWLNQKGRILDAGCGFYPHYAFTKDNIVVAGDISFESLRVARDFGDESGLVLLANFDVTHLPFVDNTFDFVIAGGELMNHVDDYEKAVLEFRRVMKKSAVGLFQVGAKWCLDSVWAIVDSLMGNWIYSVTKGEAFSFFRSRKQDVEVTWGVTPSGDFQVQLLSIRKLRTVLRRAGFQIVDQYGANSISGIIPLPVQQNSTNKVICATVSALIRLDRIVGRFPLFRTFAGNVFVVCRRES